MPAAAVSSVGSNAGIGHLTVRRRGHVAVARCSVAGHVAAWPVLRELKARCDTPAPVLRHVADAMEADMRAGLVRDGGSDLKMILSYVDSFPTGDEKGLFYALDLGGTNFRALRVQLGGKESRVVHTEFDQVSIPQDLMYGTTEELFDFIAAGLARFVLVESGRFQLPHERKGEIGFTFSFPVEQTSIDSGILIKWTKGFAVSGTAGRNVVECLNEAMRRQGLDMRVSALVNDTVATLAGAHYWDNDVMIAVVLGTGTNACYIERMDAIPKMGKLATASGNTIINTEWGAFSTGLPLTDFDKDMDSESINPGEQIFEKTISGMYLGEIVRRVLLKMAEVSALFGDSIPDKLSTPYLLGTPDLCAMQQDDSRDLNAVNTILSNTIGATTSTLEARKIVVDVCDTIVKREEDLLVPGLWASFKRWSEIQKVSYLGRGRSLQWMVDFTSIFLSTRTISKKLLQSYLGQRYQEMW